MNKKEKLTKTIIIKSQFSLFEAFQKKCTLKYKSVSEVIRDFMAKYIGEK